MQSRHSVHFDDIETQRRFEQNLIRYGFKTGDQITEEINNTILVTGGGGAGGDGWCYWIKEGSNLVYYDGHVGVGVHPHNNDFQVRGNVLVEGISEQPYVEIRNWSDTELDPVLKFSVGATPAVKYTLGVDDSDGDSFVLAAADGLTGNDYLKLKDGTLTLSDSSAAPKIVVSNTSATARDPVVQWALGASPAVKFTMGVDDSDSDSFKIAVGSALGVAYTGATGDHLRIVPYMTTIYSSFYSGEGVSTLSKISAKNYLGSTLAYVQVDTGDDSGSGRWLLYGTYQGYLEASSIQSTGDWQHYGDFVIGRSVAHTDILGFRSLDGAASYVNVLGPTLGVGASFTLTLPGALPAGDAHVACSAAGVLSFGQALGATSSPSFVALTLSQAIGTAPFTITSTTLVTNLNADLWDGYQFADYLDQSVKVAASPAFVDLNVTGVYKVDGVQVVSNRVVDARIADTPNSGDVTTDGIIAALQAAVLSHGLMAAA